ncbi:MAG: hypothetical protein ACI8PZ_004589 [Myxococcota bacterium]
MLSDPGGAGLLARLLWGLSYQRRPDTLMLLTAPHVVPTPFEADRSDPIVLVQSRLTPLDTRTLRALHSALPRLGPSDRTFRLYTPGLDRPPATDQPRLTDHVRFVRAGGLLTLRGTKEPLRVEARALLHLSRARAQPSAYDTIGDGEAQVFHDFHPRCRCAIRARRDALAAGDSPSLDGFAPRVWARTDALVHR